MEAKADRKERIAEILVEAYLTRDEVATAAKHGVCDRTIRNWKAALGDDAELAELFRVKKQLAVDSWAEEVPLALRSAVSFLVRAGNEGDHKDPHMVHSIAGAMKLLSEVSATWKLLDVRLARQAGPNGAQAGASPSGPGHLRAVSNT